MKQPLDAIVNLELAHRANELKAEAILSLGHLYLQNGLPDLALQRYQLALAHPKSVTLSRAVEALEVLANVGEWNNAAIISRQIVESDAFQMQLDAENKDNKVLSRFHRQRALIELETGDPEAGEKLVSAWLIKQPLDGLALILLARFKEEDGSREEAEMLLERAALLPQHAGAAHRAHGELLVKAGGFEGALKHLEKSQAIKPSKTLADYIEAIKGMH